jgi:predicted urease superfamily metal-dependent hydrolase
MACQRAQQLEIFGRPHLKVRGELIGLKRVHKVISRELEHAEEIPCTIAGC